MCQAALPGRVVPLVIPVNDRVQLGISICGYELLCGDEYLCGDGLLCCDGFLCGDGLLCG